jgi:predicted dithiol-disulfide oxidoreductase (DUF899 family)
MDYAQTRTELDARRAKITALREEMRALQAQAEPQPVADYTFRTPDGPVTLSDLFGDKSDLFVIHNMGRGCTSCTMWADGFNGVYDHLADRAAFVLTSPNPPDVQREFARSRGWRFPMVSHEGTSFAKDLGYWSEADGWWPGVSVLHKTQDGRILRMSDAEFDVHDDFCVTWHLLDMLPEGVNGWRPKYAYG